MMRDSAFISVQPSSSLETALDAVVNNSNTNFVHLAEIAGLDRALHFQYANLEEVDFSDCDLRGFNFTGANLTGAVGNANTVWDATTTLVDADIGGSMFEIEQGGEASDGLPKGLLGQHWADQIIWMDRLRPNPDNYREDAQKLLMVFLRSDDAFVRRTAMNLLAKHVTPDEIIEIINQHVLHGDERGLISPAFTLLKTLFHRRPAVITRLAAKHLKGKWAAEAAVFLAHILPDGKQLLHLSELLSRHENMVVRRRFIAALAERQGRAAVTAVRDPMTGDVYDFGAVISSESIDASTRFIIRRKRVAADALREGRVASAVSELRRDLDLHETFTGRTREAIRSQVVETLRIFNKFGVGYKLQVIVSFRSKYQIR